MVQIQRINVWSATTGAAPLAENYLKKTEVAIGASAQEEQIKEPANTSGLTKTVSVVVAAVTSEEGLMAEIMCATCGGTDKHYPWCAIGQLNADVAELTEAVAAKDRRIAELEAALKYEQERFYAVWHFCSVEMGWEYFREELFSDSTSAKNASRLMEYLKAHPLKAPSPTEALDALLAQAKRETLEAAAEVFESGRSECHARELRRMAREVKP